MCLWMKFILADCSGTYHRKICFGIYVLQTTTTGADRSLVELTHYNQVLSHGGNTSRSIAAGAVRHLRAIDVMGPSGHLYKQLYHQWPVLVQTCVLRSDLILHAAQDPAEGWALHFQQCVHSGKVFSAFTTMIRFPRAEGIRSTTSTEPSNKKGSIK